MTDESKNVTTILQLVVESRQRPQKVGDLCVDICRIGDGPGDFFSQELPITTTEPVNGDLDRIFAHLQRFADRFVGFLQVIALQKRPQVVE